MPGFEPPYYPIVFLRGFAMGARDIEAAADQVYTGFNDGSTKVRQTASGTIEQSFFESVVVRLMKDEDLGYADGYRDGKLEPWKDGDAPPRSFWVFRYYDLASEAFGEGRRLSIKKYATELRRFLIHTVRPSVCGNDPALMRDFRVHLVAHSMGGLVARCYLQNICRYAPAADEDDDGPMPAAEAQALDLDRLPADNLVARFFTYGTPHDGIDFLGFNVPDLGDWSITQARTFNRKNMARFLALDLPNRPWDAKHGVYSLDGAIHPSRVFNFIGTNWRDYDLPSKHVTRERSDGLVMMENAYTNGPVDGRLDAPGDKTRKRAYSPRAYAHRAHGGPLGMVNSEAGYQNLRRFLFGTHGFEASLRLLDATHTAEMGAKIAEAAAAGRTMQYWYYVDVLGSLRNVDSVLFERSADQASAVLVGPFDAGATATAFPLMRETVLMTGFLDRSQKGDGDTTMVGHLALSVSRPEYEMNGRPVRTSAPPGSNILTEEFRFSLTPHPTQPKIRVSHRTFTGELSASRATGRHDVQGVMEWRTTFGFNPSAVKKPAGSIAAELILRAWPHE
jgi:hypothetical protein